MKRRIKGLWAVIVVLLFAFGLLPISAYAADNDYIYQYPDENNFPYYQMSMYAYKINSSDKESYPTGVFRLLDTSHGNQVLYAYCADSDIFDEWGSMYKVVPLEDCSSTQSNENKLRAVVRHSYPFISQGEMISQMKADGVSLHDSSVPYYEMVLITAVQQTIYSYTNPQTVIGKSFAGAVPKAEYESYKSYIADFREEYTDSKVSGAYPEIEKDVSAVIQWLKNLPEETGPAPSVNADFKAEVLVEGNGYQLRLYDLSDDYKNAENLKVTVMKDSTSIVEDQEIVCEADGSCKLMLPDGSLNKDDVVSVTLSGEKAYTDAVAYEARTTDNSQPFIGIGTLAAQLTCTKDGIVVPEKPVVPEIRIIPANITIYMGGESGYEAVVDSDGNTSQTNTSLPNPLFYIEAPDGVDPIDITFTSAETVPGDSGAYKQWTVELAGEDRDGKKLYYLKKLHSEQDEVRVQYTIGEDTFISDQFVPGDIQELYQDYTISLYTGTVQIGQVTAAAAGSPTKYNVSLGTGILRVRAVENGDYTPETNPVSIVRAEQPAEGLAPETAAAVAPMTTRYVLNHTTVDVSADGVGLLFDDIYDKDNAGDIRESELIRQTDKALGPVGNNYNRYYQAKYLDLVDTENGNAWVKTVDQSVTVYWGYPEGTSSNTEFTLLHFENLHRDDADGASSGFSTADIAQVVPTEIKITKTEAGISFSVPSAGFSPYVLVWEKTKGGGTGGGSGSGNPKTGDLSITKNVIGEDDGNPSFTFTVSLTDQSGKELTKAFSYTGDKKGTLYSGDSVTLKDGETITLHDIPAGSRYMVTEKEADGYTTSASGERGTIREDETAKAVFENRIEQEQEEIPETPETPETPAAGEEPAVEKQPEKGEEQTPVTHDTVQKDVVLDDTPQTGDSSGISLWMGLAACAFLGFGGAAAWKNLFRRER